MTLTPSAGPGLAAGVVGAVDAAIRAVPMIARMKERIEAGAIMSGMSSMPITRSGDGRTWDGDD